MMTFIRAGLLAPLKQVGIDIFSGQADKMWMVGVVRITAVPELVCVGSLWPFLQQLKYFRMIVKCWVAIRSYYPPKLQTKSNVQKCCKEFADIIFITVWYDEDQTQQENWTSSQIEFSKLEFGLHWLFPLSVIVLWFAVELFSLNIIAFYNFFVFTTGSHLRIHVWNILWNWWCIFTTQFFNQLVALLKHVFSSLVNRCQHFHGNSG